MDNRRRRRCSGRVVALLAFVLLLSPSAYAQVYESVGIRAQGMAGAFAAVADDASAIWWNPAGLAAGAYVNGIIEMSGGKEPAGDPVWRSSTGGFAVAMPALGISYYRIRISEIQPSSPTETRPLDRQDRRQAPVFLRSLVVQQVGITVGQSVGEHLVLASTLKLVHGSFASAATEAGEAVLDRADDLSGQGATRGDLDVGAMAALGAVRVALVVKNVAHPSFQTAADSVALGRQVRVGVSTTLARGAHGAVIVAADADATRTPTAAGDVRHVTAGIEAWTPSRVIGLRGGVSANTIGDARPAGSVGLSLAVRSGLYVDGQLTRGSDKSRRGWGFGLRMTF